LRTPKQEKSFGSIYVRQRLVSEVQPNNVLISGCLIFICCDT